MNEHIQINVSIPRGIDTVNVFGPSDNYIKAIKEQIDNTLRIHLGNSDGQNVISVFGKKESGQAAEEVFEKLMEIACSNAAVSTDEVRLISIIHL